MRLDRWTNGDREAPEPLEGNITATVTGLTLVWFALFLVQLPFYGWYADRGHDWWIWTCLAGGGLGLIGLWYVRAREASLRRAAGASESDAPRNPKAQAARGTAPTGDPDGSRDGSAPPEHGPSPDDGR